MHCWSKLPLALLVTGLAQATWALPAPQTPLHAGLLGEGTPFETPWFDSKGTHEGPTVLIIGGMHGNEPAGAAAAEAIACWTVQHGRVVVAPRMNPPALAAQKRLIPGLSEPEGNLNRHFPTRSPVREGIATDLWALFEAVEPDWVLDLHEGFAFRRQNSGSVGSSVIACADERATSLATKMIAAVDATIVDADRKFTLLKDPIESSFARAAWENAGVPSMILETTYGKYASEGKETRSFGVSLRARQHRLMVHTFLTELGMQPCSPDVLVNRAVTGGGVHAAIYDDLGTSSGGARELDLALASFEGVVTRRVSSLDVNAGVLSQFDVVLHPGGSGSGQASSLGEAGRAKEIEFIRAGGGYLGVCAGGYLAACNYSWSLAILDARTIDTKNGHWRRGRAHLEIELTAPGLELFGDREPRFDIKYANGPIWAPGERDEIPDYETLALYRGEVADHGTSKGIMPGTPALIRGAFGKGRAVAFSPHPEGTDGLQHFIGDAVLWAAGRN